MQHKRHCRERQKLIKEIHGQQIRSKGNAQCDTVSDTVKHKKDLFPLFMLHILKRIQHRQRPEQRYKPGKDHRYAVDLKGDRQILHKMDNMKYFCCSVQNQLPHDGGSCQHDDLQIAHHYFSVFKRNEQGQYPSEDREQYGC